MPRPLLPSHDVLLQVLERHSNVERRRARLRDVRRTRAPAVDRERGGRGIRCRISTTQRRCLRKNQTRKICDELFHYNRNYMYSSSASLQQRGAAPTCGWAPLHWARIQHGGGQARTDLSRTPTGARDNRKFGATRGKHARTCALRARTGAGMTGDARLSHSTTSARSHWTHTETNHVTN